MTITDQIVQTAQYYYNQDITEIQPNNGWADPAYEADMRSVGWQKGDEWCAAAAILCWKKGYAANLPVWKIAQRLVSLNCMQMVHNFYADPVWPTSVNMPKLGAIAVWQAGNSAVYGHCGIVTAINGEHFTTVEGNTTSAARPNPDPHMNEREGWTVAAHTHTIGLPHSTLGLNLIRFIYAIRNYGPLVV